MLKAVSSFKKRKKKKGKEKKNLPEATRYDSHWLDLAKGKRFSLFMNKS